MPGSIKREGKNTSTLLFIKGFLWEDIKSIPIFLSAPAGGTIPAGSTHSSPIRSATKNIHDTRRKQWVGNPSETFICGFGKVREHGHFAVQVTCYKFTHPHI